MEIWYCDFRILNVYNILHEKISNNFHQKKYNCIKLETLGVDIISILDIHNQKLNRQSLIPPHHKR